MIRFLIENWHVLLEALIALIWVIVRLTPTEVDNRVFAFIVKLLTVLIPNNRKGGGVHR